MELSDLSELSDLLHQPAGEVLHNARIKTFPSGLQEVLVCERPIFKAPGWELRRKARRYPEDGDPRPRDDLPDEPERAEANRQRSMRRARAQVRELALANDFRYFVTLTLDRERIDRYDVAAITKRLNTWLDNNVRRRGLKYVLVPEHHKDGAVHFHGLVNDALPVVDSGHLDKAGHKVYNLPRWGYGFSTAIELYGEYDRAVSYVCKYIGKQTGKVGGRWFYSGGALDHASVDLCDMDISDAMQAEGAYTFSVEDAGLGFVGFALRKEHDNDREAGT